ncbi:MAG: hypothetical protein J6V90_07945 [Treponema sp.]|nr:hypothetical protein [Treponema sp.]
MVKNSLKVTITTRSPIRGQTKEYFYYQADLRGTLKDFGNTIKDWRYGHNVSPHRGFEKDERTGKFVQKDMSAREAVERVRKHFRQQIEDSVIEQMIPALYGAAMKQRRAQCDYFGVYFQHLVSRTPEDENYTYKVDIISKKGKLLRSNVTRHHTKDKDVIKKDWVIEGFSAGGGSLGVIKADDIALSGCFDKFGDKSSTNMVSGVMYDRWLKSNGKMLSSVKVKNVNPRFSLLEYGEYEVKNHGKNKDSGNKYWHGTTTDGYTLQAPQGMLRVTNAEFEYMQGMKNPAKYAKNAHFSKKITRSQMQKLAQKLQGNKFKFNFKLNSQEVEEFLDGFA